MIGESPDPLANCTPDIVSGVTSSRRREVAQAQGQSSEAFLALELRESAILLGNDVTDPYYL
jgi:hypothetical protein